ncbi:MAG: methylmalonyl Co-A mutase-associated GTPase MeaB [Planctomycetes bacterium]|nr:methylmalonyl Co-A mutase-associated GTPase MeaB [Planctomycetota bacterium]
MDSAALIPAFRAGDRRALSRLLTYAERGDDAFPALYDELAPSRGHAMRLGITGPPGAGKSTFVSALVTARRNAGERVAVLAIDPTSPFTGGALLGDRIRMQEHVLDSGVFVRSMATRGSLGGLSRASLEASDLLDVFGFPHVVIETVGVGQVEHDIIEAADLVTVVLSPGAGDGVQALKAGLMEIADVFVINKADLPGADQVAVDLREMLALRSQRHGDEIPVVRCSSIDGEGLGEAIEAIDRRWHTLEHDGRLAARRHERSVVQVRRLVEQSLRERLFGSDEDLEQSLSSSDLARPYAACDMLLDRFDAQTSRSPASPTHKRNEPR